MALPTITCITDRQNLTEALSFNAVNRSTSKWLQLQLAIP